MLYGNRTQCDNGHALGEARSLKTKTAPDGSLSITCNRCVLRRRGYTTPHPDAIHPEDVHRFWSKVRVVEDGCWEWLASKNKRGYGWFAIGKARRPAHRVSYCLHTGEAIPDGLEIDHECRNPSCVRPDHLEPVTHAENMARARRAGIGECPKGHDDWYWYRGYAKCRTCRKSRQQTARAQASA